MKKINYTEEIKKLCQDIDFDETANNIYNEFLNFENDSLSDFYSVIKNLPAKNFHTNKEIDFEDYVTRIFFGRKNMEIGQHLYQIYTKNAKKAKLSNIVITGKRESAVNTAIINNPNHYVKQLLNLAHAAGADLKCGYPNNEHKNHLLIENSYGGVWYLTIDKQNKGYFYILLYRYFNYIMMINDKRIQCDNKESQIKELSEKYKNSEILYNQLKKIFNNVDFIYAILTYLDGEDKINFYLKMIERNESFNNGRKLGTDIIQFMTDAFYLYKEPLPERYR